MEKRLTIYGKSKQIKYSKSKQIVIPPFMSKSTQIYQTKSNSSAILIYWNFGLYNSTMKMILINLKIKPTD